MCCTTSATRRHTADCRRILASHCWSGYGRGRSSGSAAWPCSGEYSEWRCTTSVMVPRRRTANDRAILAPGTPDALAGRLHIPLPPDQRARLLCTAVVLDGHGPGGRRGGAVL